MPVNALEVRGPRALGYAPGLFQRLLDADLDLLHVHGIWMYPSRDSLRWAQATGRPVVISPHGMLDPWAVRHSAWKKRVFGWLIEHRHLRKAACLHAWCDAERDAVRAFGVTNPVAIIPNGIDLPALSPADVSAPWVGRIPADSRVLLYLGRIHFKKNLTSLLRAWAVVCARCSADWWLVIAGWDQGGHEAELRALVEREKVPHVAFVGPQFDEAKVASFYQADAFVLPSLSEGLPMVVLEAWSFGLPVLMSRECNLTEGFNAGSAVEIETYPEEIAVGLATLFSMDLAERVAMGTKGRALVERLFTWGQVAQSMSGTYRWLLSLGPRPKFVFDR